MSIPRSSFGSSENLNPQRSRRRSAIIAAISCAYGILVLILSAVEKPIFEAFCFSVLQALLLHACFRWWSRPLYRTVFAYISPLCIFNSLAFVYYGAGNLLAYVAHDLMYAGNPGADAYYVPALAVAVASAYGFDFIYRQTARALGEEPAAYPPQEAMWRFMRDPGAPLVMGIAGILAAAAVIYIQRKYVVTTVQQFATQSQLDNILFISTRGFVGIVGVACIYLAYRRPGVTRKIALIGLLCAFAPFMLVYASRLMLISVIASGVVTFMLLKGRVQLRAILVMAALLCASWVLVRAIKDTRSAAPDVTRTRGQSTSAASEVSATLGSSSIWLPLLPETSKRDALYRMAALDFPAAIYQATMSDGASPMWGQDAWISFLGLVPHALWRTKTVGDPEGVITEHFGFSLDDQLTTPLPTACADAGMLGGIFLMSALGWLLCLAQHWIMRWRFGLLLYLSSLPYLFAFETSLVQYFLMWLRFALMLWVVFGALIVFAPAPRRKAKQWRRLPGAASPRPA